MQIFVPRNVYEQVDDLRRWQGRLLEWVGLGPIETPSRVVFSERGVSLHAYEDSDRLGPVLVIVPAPIKRAYIWDLAPWASVSHSLLIAGFSSSSLTPLMSVSTINSASPEAAALTAAAPLRNRAAPPD